MNISFCIGAYDRNSTHMPYREIGWFIHSTFTAGVNRNYKAGLPFPVITTHTQANDIPASDSSPFPALLLLFWVQTTIKGVTCEAIFIAEGWVNRKTNQFRMYMNLVIGLTVHGKSGQSWPRWRQQKAVSLFFSKYTCNVQRAWYGFSSMLENRAGWGQ